MLADLPYCPKELHPMKSFSRDVSQLEAMLRKQHTDWSCRHTGEFYALQKGGSGIVKDYIEKSVNDDFCDEDWLFEDRHLL
jgi:hypothetical protein